MPNNHVSPTQKPPLLDAITVFLAALAFLFALAPAAPFTKELGACETGAVRDVMAGNVILPRFEPKVLVHTPPLYWWVAAVGASELGFNEFSLRLPPMIAWALVCALVFMWTAIVASRRAGLVAAAALLFCHFCADAARQPRMDTMLALFVTAAIIALERALAPPTRHRSLLLAGAALAMALGILDKGPLGILLPGLVLAVYLLLRRRWRDMFSPGLIITFVVAVVLGLAWYVAAYRVGGDYFLWWQVKEGLLKRFVPESAGGADYCVHPLYYFIPVVLGGLMPWTVFLPALALLYAQRASPLREPLVFAGCWFIAIFGFFSASSGKCFVYILPAFPPLAAMLGMLCHELAERREPSGLRRTFEAGSGALIAGTILISFAMLWLAFFGAPAGLLAKLHRSDREFLLLTQTLIASGSRGVIVWAGLWLAGIALTIRGLVGRRIWRQACGAGVIAGAGVLLWFGTINPARAEQQTLRGFALQLDTVLPPGAGAEFVGPWDCDLIFYAKHHVTHVPTLAEAANVRYLIFWQDNFQRLPAQQQARFRILTESAAVDHHGPRLLVESVATP